jgi:hypothetical protein
MKILKFLKIQPPHWTKFTQPGASYRSWKPVVEERFTKAQIRRWQEQEKQTISPQKVSYQHLKEAVFEGILPANAESYFIYDDKDKLIAPFSQIVELSQRAIKKGLHTLTSEQIQILLKATIQLAKAEVTETKGYLLNQEKKWRIDSPSEVRATTETQFISTYASIFWNNEAKKHKITDSL